MALALRRVSLGFVLVLAGLALVLTASLGVARADMIDGGGSVGGGASGGSSSGGGGSSSGGGTVTPTPPTQMTGVEYWPEGVTQNNRFGTISCDYLPDGRRPLGFRWSVNLFPNGNFDTSTYKTTCLYAAVPTTKLVACSWGGRINIAGPYQNAQQPFVAPRNPYASQSFAAAFQTNQTVANCGKRLDFYSGAEITAYGRYQLTATPLKVWCSETVYEQQSATIGSCGAPFASGGQVVKAQVWCGGGFSRDWSGGHLFSDEECVGQNGAPGLISCAPTAPTVAGLPENPRTRSFWAAKGTHTAVTVRPASVTGAARNARNWAPITMRVDSSRGYWESGKPSGYTPQNPGQSFYVQTDGPQSGYVYLMSPEDMGAKPLMIVTSQAFTADVESTRVTITQFGPGVLQTRIDTVLTPARLSCTTDIPVRGLYPHTVYPNSSGSPYLAPATLQNNWMFGPCDEWLSGQWPSTWGPQPTTDWRHGVYPTGYRAPTMPNFLGTYVSAASQPTCPDLNK